MTTSIKIMNAPNAAQAVRQIATSGLCKGITAALLLACATGVGLAQFPAYGTQEASFPGPVRGASTVPSKGDVNPYGVAFVGNNFINGSGPLRHGDILVSNFNNKQKVQRAGTTILRIPATGDSPSVFFRGTAPLGLSTGLATLQYGLVLVANLPTLDGTAATAKSGSLLVINNEGKLIQTFANSSINGPWDMTVIDRGDRASAFFSNALDGTVSRVDFSVTGQGLSLLNHSTIASGFAHQADPAALFDAPTGLVYDQQRDMLYVASTADNLVFGIPQASRRASSEGPGYVIYDDPTHLHGALAMAQAPNGRQLVTNHNVVNSDPKQPGEIVKFAKEGDFVNEIPVEPTQGGSFGRTFRAVESGITTLAAVDGKIANRMIRALTL